MLENQNSTQLRLTQLFTLFEIGISITKGA